MSYTNEDIRKASELFFHLLKNRILPASDILASQYYEHNEISEILNNTCKILRKGLRCNYEFNNK